MEFVARGFAFSIIFLKLSTRFHLLIKKHKSWNENYEKKKSIILHVPTVTGQRPELMSHITARCALGLHQNGTFGMVRQK